MDDEVKRIRFRNNNKIYIAGAIDLSHFNVNIMANFMVCIAAIRIYEEGSIESLGGVIFHQSTLLDYLWADPSKKRFPDKEFLDEALINLLHYLPIDEDKLIPDGNSFIYRFTRDQETGLINDQNIFNIKVEGSMEKTYKKLMFKDKPTEDEIYRVFLEPLYMHRKDSFNTNLLTKQIKSMLPFEMNEIDSFLEELEYKKFVDILKDSSGTYISVKITPQGCDFLSGKINDTINEMKNVHYGHNFNIKTGDNSPVNIQANIATEFEEIKKELDEKNPKNKIELLNDINELQEIIKEPKDLNKVKNLLTKIRKGAEWLGKRIEPIVQQVIASYISGQLPK